MSWNRLRGHEPWIEAFDRLVRNGRLAHAYLLVGAGGIGKKSFAIELAKALLCEGRQNGDRLEACDRCSACLLFEAGTHPDFFFVRRPEEENVFPVASMRELCRNFSLKSARGRGKIAVVDDADDLNDESANTFLKTLEEPPPRSVFFLIGTSRDRQLPTILSRCQLIRFAALSNVVTADVLAQQGVTDAALVEPLLQLSGGSPGQALALADPDLWRFRSQLLDELSSRPFDPIALSKMWIHYVEAAGKETALQRRRGERLLRLLVEFLRDALAFATGGQPRLTGATELQRLRTFVIGRSPERIVELIERSLDAEMQIKRYIQLALILEGMVSAFCE